MESKHEVAQTIFETYLSEDYKTCAAAMNKLKNSEVSSEREAAQIKQNLIIAEFMAGKQANVTILAEKLEELFFNVKTQLPPPSKSDSTKGSEDLEEDLSGLSTNEADDIAIFKYNYATSLQLAGKKNQSAALLEELYQNKDNVDDFLLLKSTLIYLEIAIAQKDFPTIKKLMDYFEDLKKYIGLTRSTPLPGENEEGKETSGDDASQNITGLEKGENDYYNSLIFGSEIYKFARSPTAFSRLEFQYILGIFQIYLFIAIKEQKLAEKKLSMCSNILNDLSRVIKDGKTEKSNVIARFNNKISEHLDRHVNVIYSFAEAYLAYNNQSFGDCMRILNTIDILTFVDKEILAYTALQLNNVGCCHLKMKKFSLAAHYLSKALNIVQNLNKDIPKENKKNDKLLNLSAIQQYPSILHNYAAAISQLGKLDETVEAYSLLAEFWPDNAKIWYRTATAHIEKCHEIMVDNQNQKKNSIYQSLLDLPTYGQMVDEERAEQAKSRKTEEIDHKENPYYIRYVLQGKDFGTHKTEEELSAAPAAKYLNQNPDINKGNDGTPPHLTDKHLRMHLEKAAKCYRNAVLICKKKRAKTQKTSPIVFEFDSQGLAEDEDEGNQKEIDIGEAEETKKKTINVKATKNMKEYQEILQSSLCYLAYISVSLGEFYNTINYSKECLELPYITDEIKYICLMYLVESYCYLGNQKEALDQMSSAKFTQSILTTARNALGFNQAVFNKNLSSKVVIYTNLATAHILNNNLTGAQNAINIAMSNIDPGLAQYPISLLNFMIYLNLRMDKPEVALQILKRRRPVSAGNTKLLLRIVKWLS